MESMIIKDKWKGGGDWRCELVRNEWFDLHAEELVDKLQNRIGWLYSEDQVCTDEEEDAIITKMAEQCGVEKQYMFSDRPDSLIFAQGSHNNRRGLFPDLVRAIEEIANAGGKLPWHNK